MTGEMEAFSRLKSQQDFLTCGLEGPRHTSSAKCASSFSSLNVNNTFSISEFKKKLRIEIKELSPERVILELIDIDVAFANALRRILIAEVPTVVIETVHLWQNTGVIQDEVLAHRLGLIPLRIDPDLIEWKKENEEYTDENSVKFKFHVTCTQSDIGPLNTSKSVYAKDLVWVPLSEKQKAKFGKNPPAPVEPNILITKLRPGQEIEAELYCEKNIGKVHAKWSPVATAVYRLLPVLEFPKGPITTEAEELKNLCPMNVFDVEDGVSVASRPRWCTTCRACLERFPGRVSLVKNKRHFIFTIESTGAIPATDLFQRAIRILRGKAVMLRQNVAMTVEKSSSH